MATWNVLSLNRAGSLRKLKEELTKYVERMSEERVVKRLYQNTQEGSKSVGRPRLSRMDDVRRMGVTNWRIRAHRRDDWKMVVKEAKVLQGLQSHGVVVASDTVKRFTATLNKNWDSAATYLSLRSV